MTGKIQRELGKEDAKTYQQARYFASKLTRVESVAKLEGALLLHATKLMMEKEGAK